MTIEIEIDICFKWNWLKNDIGLQIFQYFIITIDLKLHTLLPNEWEHHYWHGLYWATFSFENEKKIGNSFSKWANCTKKKLSTLLDDQNSTNNLRVSFVVFWMCMKKWWNTLYTWTIRCSACVKSISLNIVKYRGRPLR